MKIIKRSLFIQHFLVLAVLMLLFSVLIYQFSVSSARKDFAKEETVIAETNARTAALIAYQIKLNEGTINRKNLKSYINNLISVNSAIQQISIFDTIAKKEIVQIGEIEMDNTFSLVDKITNNTKFVSPPKNMNLTDELAYKLLGLIYSIVIDTPSKALLQGQTRRVLITKQPLNNVQIEIITAYKDFENTYNFFIKTMSLGFISVMFILLIFFLFLNFRVIYPLKKLKQGALEIARGNLRSEVNIKGPNEIGIVGTFFSEVSRNLREITHELYEKDRLEGEMNIAARIQEGLIPPHAPDIPGLDIKLGYKAAEEIGGDALDFIIMDEDNVLMYIGDVSGHGLPAGLVMTMIDVLIHGFADVYSNVETMMINVNKHITPKIDASMFMTMLMMNWNHTDQKFTYVGGGHESILHYKAATREVNNIKAGGIAIGMINDNTPLVQTGEIRPQVGDVIVLYTDGIPEAKGGEQSKEFYGLERFMHHVAKFAVQSTADLIFESLVEDLSKHMGKSKQMDDITLIVMKYTGITSHEKSIKLSIDETHFKPVNRSGKWSIT